MKRVGILLTAVLLVCGLVWVDTSAQNLPENHYLVRNTDGNYTFQGQIELRDQFKNFTATYVDFEKFACPVDKNGEMMYDPAIHQTWWVIDDPQSIWWTLIENQFGDQTLRVKDGRYLVLPANKGNPTSFEGFNHYKCYDAIGPSLDLNVELTDQFGSYTMVVREPVLFCNPVEKIVNGVTYEIFSPDVHLACYRVEPFIGADYSVWAFDQFGDWYITAHDPCWLCVPSLKLETVPNQNRTWGAIKSLYAE